MRPYLASYYQRLGIPGVAQAGDDSKGFLTPDAISEDSPLSFLRKLVLESDASGATDLVLLSGVSRPDEIRSIAKAVPGVTIRRSDRGRDAIARRVSPPRDDPDRGLGAVDDAGSGLALWSSRRWSRDATTCDRCTRGAPAGGVGRRDIHIFQCDGAGPGIVDWFRLRGLLPRKRTVAPARHDAGSLARDADDAAFFRAAGLQQHIRGARVWRDDPGWDDTGLRVFSDCERSWARVPDRLRTGLPLCDYY